MFLRRAARLANCFTPFSFKPVSEYFLMKFSFYDLAERMPYFIVKDRFTL